MVCFLIFIHCLKYKTRFEIVFYQFLHYSNYICFFVVFFSCILNVNDLMHNVSVLMILAANEFLGAERILLTIHLHIFLSSQKCLT